MGVTLRFGLVLLIVLANGFFVAAEYALVSARPTRLEAMAERGNRLAGLVLRAKEDPNRYISGSQLGITIMSLALGWLGEDVLADLVGRLLRLLPIVPVAGTGQSLVAAHSIAVPVAFVLITLLHIVMGEQVPKLIALQRAEAASLVSIQPMRVWGRLLRPFILLLSWLTNTVLQLLGLTYRAEYAASHSPEELKMLLASSDALDETEQTIAERAVEFGELTIRQVMVPRTELVALPAEATLAELLETSVRTHHRRFPVYAGSPDDIEGLVHVLDALRDTLQVTAGRPGNATIETYLRQRCVRDVMRDLVTVPETLSVTRVMAEMRRRRQTAVLVVDEYGGTAGFATWQDILERVIGEMPDEFEPEAPEIQIVADGALIDGRTLIEDVNERFDLHLETEGYDTIGGFVFSRLGRKPDVGDQVEAAGYRFRVEALDGLRIATVRLQPAEPASPSGPPSGAMPDGGV